MQIGEVAERTALTVDAIRFYEKRKLLPRANRSAGRFRLYTEDDIERVRFIRQMQGLGFSLREVGDLIHLRERKADACESVRELLKAKLTDVRAKLRGLRDLESELEGDLRKCNRELNHRWRHAVRLPGARRGDRSQSMRIEILYVPDCPNYPPAFERLGAVLASEAVQDEIHCVRVSTEAQAKDLSFPGSHHSR